MKKLKLCKEIKTKIFTINSEFFIVNYGIERKNYIVTNTTLKLFVKHSYTIFLFYVDT